MLSGAVALSGVALSVAVRRANRGPASGRTAEGRPRGAKGRPRGAKGRKARQRERKR